MSGVSAIAAPFPTEGVPVVGKLSNIAPSPPPSVPSNSGLGKAGLNVGVSGVITGKVG